ncbi:MAG: hypothetical protein ACRDDF_05590 [Aeromonas sp.]
MEQNQPKLKLKSPRSSVQLFHARLQSSAVHSFDASSEARTHKPWAGVQAR